MLTAVSLESLISEGLDSLKKQAKVRGLAQICLFSLETEQPGQGAPCR